MGVEFFKTLPERAMKDWTQILNQLCTRGKLPREWRMTVIYPLHKGGNEDEVSNYRGISLLNTGYKVLANILVKRLKNWVEQHNILGESQAGFRSGRATRDHIFILNALVNNKMRRAWGKLYRVSGIRVLIF